MNFTTLEFDIRAFNRRERGCGSHRLRRLKNLGHVNGAAVALVNVFAPSRSI